MDLKQFSFLLFLLLTIPHVLTPFLISYIRTLEFALEVSIALLIWFSFLGNNFTIKHEGLLKYIEWIKEEKKW